MVCGLLVYFFAYYRVESTLFNIYETGDLTGSRAEMIKAKTSKWEN
jgi:hypothetical protein